MWKQDKKDFAQEMGKLKTLKGKLAILEYRYLTEFQVRGSSPPTQGWALLLDRCHLSMVREAARTLPQKEPLPPTQILPYKPLLSAKGLLLCQKASTT